MKRGTGETTRQMKALPIGGLFISCQHTSVDYDKRLAQFIGRPDIIVVPPTFVTDQTWRGRNYPGLAVDHWYSSVPRGNLERDEFYYRLNDLRTRIRP